MPLGAGSSGTLARMSLLALAYLTAALVGIDLSREAGGIAVFWPANALLVGALARIGPRDRAPTLAACAIASLAAYKINGDALGIALALAAANMLDVWCGHRLLARLAGPTFRVADLRDLLMLLAASLIAPAAGATASSADRGLLPRRFRLLLVVDLVDPGQPWHGSVSAAGGGVRGCARQTAAVRTAGLAAARRHLRAPRRLRASGGGARADRQRQLVRLANSVRAALAVDRLALRDLADGGRGSHARCHGGRGGGPGRCGRCRSARMGGSRRRCCRSSCA